MCGPKPVGYEWATLLFYSASWYVYGESFETKHESRLWGSTVQAVPLRLLLTEQRYMREASEQELISRGTPPCRRGRTPSARDASLFESSDRPPALEFMPLRLKDEG